MVTGANAAAPNDTLGWGEINAYSAALELGNIIHPMQTWTDTAFHICAGIASKFPIENATLTYFGDSDIYPHTAGFQLAADSLVYSCTTAEGSAALTDLGTRMYYQISVTDGSGATSLYPLSGWEMLTLPGSSGNADVRTSSNGSVPSQVEAYPNPCSTGFQLDLSTPGEWQIVDASGAMIAGDRSQGPSSIRVPTSQLANGSYYVEFISTSGEAKTIPVVVLH